MFEVETYAASSQTAFTFCFAKASSHLSAQHFAKTGASKQSMYGDPLEKTQYVKRNLYAFRVKSRNFLHLCGLSRRFPRYFVCCTEIRVRNRRQRNVTTPRGSPASLFEKPVFLHLQRLFFRVRPSVSASRATLKCA